MHLCVDILQQFLTKQEDRIQNQIFCCFGCGKPEIKLWKQQLVFVVNRPPCCESERLKSSTQSHQREKNLFLIFRLMNNKKRFLNFLRSASASHSHLCQLQAAENLFLLNRKHLSAQMGLANGDNPELIPRGDLSRV